MNNKLKVTMKKSCFVISRKNKAYEEQFFGGFYNEVECVGTEEECQCWENEEWVDRVEEAIQFKTFQEARDFLSVIGNAYSPSIVLYGLHDEFLVRNMNDSQWYPLKTFYATNMGEY